MGPWRADLSLMSWKVDPTVSATVSYSEGAMTSWIRIQGFGFLQIGRLSDHQEFDTETRLGYLCIMS